MAELPSNGKTKNDKPEIAEARKLFPMKVKELAMQATKKIESSTDNDGKNHTAALNMSELKYYLATATSTRKTVYDSLDGKLNGELEKVKRPETVLNSV